MKILNTKQKQSPRGVPKNFTKFTRKRLFQSLFFSKVADFRVAILIKKRLRHRYFLVNFAKILRTPFYRIAPVPASVKVLNTEGH